MTNHLPSRSDEPPPPTPSEADARRSPLLIEEGFQHAFFTRRGGVSLPPYDTLSFSVAGGDDPLAVLENRRRAARALGVRERALHYLSQVHGTEAQVLTPTDDPDEVVRRVGDITVSSSPGVACGVRSADCVPVLLADRVTGSVAAVHSGWKGTLARASVIGVERLRAIIDGRSDIIAAIGPCISVCCFEVGDDVASLLCQASSAGASALSHGRATESARRRTGRVEPTPRIDLRKIVRAQLIECGIAEESIEDVEGCTVCSPELFHSYRRDGERSGRMLSAIAPRGA